MDHIHLEVQKKMSDMQREIEVLRDDFQQLEQAMHTQRESFEAEVEMLKETIRNY